MDFLFRNAVMVFHCKMLSIAHKQKIIEFWFETKSASLVRRKFISYFGLVGRAKSLAPDNKAINRIIYHWRKNASIHNASKGRSGRKKKRTPEKIDEVRQSVERSPGNSLTMRAREVGLTKSTTWRILRADLNVYPYKISVHHRLKHEDEVRRVAMCKKFDEKMTTSPSWIDNVFFSDEAHFYQTGAVINSQNHRFWGNELPDEVEHKQLKSGRVTAFCAINKVYGVFGPYWFMDDNKKTETINCKRYCDIVDKFVSDLERKLPAYKFAKVVFMQDGATPHTAISTLQHLKQTFRSRIISLKTDFEWAPHSPDLNPLDFFFWGSSKSEVYKSKPKSLEDLRENLEVYARSVSIETCKKVMQNFAIRINACISRRGSHIEHINYKRFADL